MYPYPRVISIFVNGLSPEYIRSRDINLDLKNYLLDIDGGPTTIAAAELASSEIVRNILWP